MCAADLDAAHNKPLSFRRLHWTSAQVTNPLLGCTRQAPAGWFWSICKPDQELTCTHS